MSYAIDKFLKAMGSAKPRAKDGMHFSIFIAGSWKNAQKEGVHPGYYKNRFYYLFGEGLERYQRCIDAWSFLVDTKRPVTILGKNAYGSLLVLEDSDDAETSRHIGVLDTTLAQYTARTDWYFSDLWVGLLVNRELDIFTDESAYLEWRELAGKGKAKKPYLDEDEILGPVLPLPLGGTMSMTNFRPQNIFEYYESTAPIYKKAYRQVKRSKKK
jgi:hypothetical protein